MYTQWKFRSVYASTQSDRLIRLSWGSQEAKASSWLSQLMIKPTKWYVHPAKTQIILGIHPVWSESLLSAWWKLWSLSSHWGHNEDWSDWADGLSPRRVHRHFVVFVMRQLSCGQQRLIRLGGWAGWSVSYINNKHNDDMIDMSLVTFDKILLCFWALFSGNCWGSPLLLELRHEKTCFSHMRTTKVQISLRIRAVWSAPLLFAT